MLNERLRSLSENLHTLDDKMLFFVGGFPKSGTTWVERVLDSHPEIVCKGEAHFGSLLEPALREAIAGYNAVIPKKGNWVRHRREGRQDLPPTRYSFLSRELDVLYACAIQLMLLKWLDTPDIKCIGEKTPNNSQYFERIAALFPQARFIFVIRDVRDVVVSGWFFNLAIGSRETLNHFNTVDEYSRHIARAWVQNVAAGLRFVAGNPERARALRYEDLWQHPAAEAAQLFDFLGVDSTEAVINTCLAYTDFARLSGGRDRGVENRSSFYRKGIIGDWRNHLRPGTAADITATAGPLMRQLGYE